MSALSPQPLVDLAEYGKIQAEPLRPQTRRVILQETAARLYAGGLSRRQVAVRLRDYLAPEVKHPDIRTNAAVRILKKMEQELEFRDMVYDFSVGKTDLQIPAILNGVVKKAKAGRVDAARLVLEVTGRHNPRGDATPTAIQIVVEGVPRPARARVTEEDGDVIELSGPDVREEGE